MGLAPGHSPAPVSPQSCGLLTLSGTQDCLAWVGALALHVPSPSDVKIRHAHLTLLGDFNIKKQKQQNNDKTLL